MEDLINTYTTIDSYPEDRYKLSALLNSNGDYVMVSFDFDKEMWDNEFYLLNTLHHTINEFVVNRRVTSDFEDIIKFIPIGDFNTVHAMFMKGVKLGFFKHVNA